MRSFVFVLVACSSAPPRAEPPPKIVVDAAIATVVIDTASTSLLVPDAATTGRIIVTETDQCGFILDFLYFDSNSSEVAPRQQPILDATAVQLACGVKDEGITKIEVQGHADDKERDPLRLSEDRALKVANALASKGVPAGVLVPVGYGSSAPMDAKKTAAARAKNRRVGFLILQRKAD
jgi:outer membrane protein OmpA-like peptidoglycan-associated protein